ncbi:winged helix-turn-helix domain-containing protein [Enterococcus sp. AZ072]|uniref:winged helix-turn-helix domain-containing protein n=1 Tax=unclassified Enterococcus TaxID=2608891 RepID=UPI003D2ACA20
MKHVLILTRNVLSEESLIQQLHYLNYEVLCSAHLIQPLEDGKILPVISYFKIVIISETISDNEVVNILPTLNSYGLVVIRAGESPSPDEKRMWKENGILHWINKLPSVKELREGLAEAAIILEEKIGNKDHFKSFSTKHVIPLHAGNLRSVYMNFTKSQKNIFDRLLWAQNQETILSRKDLCDYLWNDGITNSNLSQLSCLIQKIRNKFKQCGLPYDVITTVWGKGYELNEEFYQCWLTEEQEMSLQKNV